RKIGHVPIRKARASRVVADEHPPFGEGLGPMAPDRIVPIELEVREPVVDSHQGWPLTRRRKSDPCVVARRAEAYSLFHPPPTMNRCTIRDPWMIQGPLGQG